MKFLPFSIMSADTAALKDFLGYLATVKGDLSQVTAPAPLLSPKSIVEYPGAWAVHHSLFLLPATQPSPKDRAVSILKNFICSLRAQQFSTIDSNSNSSDGGVKKPLNPFLGELFLARITDPQTGKDSGTDVLCEQVSHHPPVTASYLSNKEYGVSCTGYLSQTTAFSPTAGVTITQYGHALTHLTKFNEYHLITFPILKVKGLITGGRYPELSGTCHIVSSSGFTSTIQFTEQTSSKMGLSTKGEKHGVTATLSKSGSEDKPLVKLTGSWNGKLTITDYENGETVEEFYVDQAPMSKIMTKPVEEQDAWESQRAWKTVKSALKCSDWKAATDEKRKIEEGQRNMRAAEREGGRQWVPKFFKTVERCEMFDKLAEVIKEPIYKERTAGVWKYIGPEDIRGMKGPFYSGVLPTGESSE